MPNIVLPDGSVRNFKKAVNGAELAASIGPGLTNAAMMIIVDGVQYDLTHELEHDCQVLIITRKDEVALQLIRHDCAHVMAEAVTELFPETQVTIGPAIENGFYYDFYREKPFVENDLQAIEKRMHEIVDRGQSFIREIWSREQAVKHYKKIDEPF